MAPDINNPDNSPSFSRGKLVQIVKDCGESK